MSKQIRPSWCPHKDCIFLTTVQNKICGGKLSKPIKHENDYNTHRLCINTQETGHGIFDLQINFSDTYWFGLIFDWLRKDMKPNLNKNE